VETRRQGAMVLVREQEEGVHTAQDSLAGLVGAKEAEVALPARWGEEVEESLAMVAAVVYNGTQQHRDTHQPLAT